MMVELPYSLHGRYLAIAVAWTIILIPPIFINIGLFYGLWYGKPQMNRIIVLTIPTAVLGVFTALAIIERVWKLIQLSPKYRPLKSPRYSLDIFQWGYFGALILISVLISTTLARGDVDNDDHELQLRLVSFPVSVLLCYLATLALLTLGLNAFGISLPFRFGSFEPGTIVKPAIYYIVEDVIAVDGNGGSEFRAAWMARYESSPIFEKMIWRLTVCWAISFIVIAIVFIYLVLRLPVAAVYAVGWAGPFPLVGVLAIGTIRYVKSVLKQEQSLEVFTNSTIAATRPADQTGQPSDETAPLLGRPS